ncbi:RpiB/LacA/LacB family sugar-phosphate isomerase [Candidatus Microgenomates bacterium]|jgi:ribose 5-phosphate isomerase B|nr:MAG: RpiB/LacA/LacB family sugar-phosphate isomerase [Candidatus Microgenomates bacterium]
MIYLGADHRGFELKEKVKKWLESSGYQYEDLGSDHLSPEDDYPDFAVEVAKKLGKGDFGILFCGSGVGVDIVANKFSGIRCGLGFSQQQIRVAKRDDDINCLAIPADFLSETETLGIIQMFLETQFSGSDKYQRRVEKIKEIEKNQK